MKEHDIVDTKEGSIVLKIMKVFVEEKIKLQHSVLNYHIDLYFSEYRLAVEIDEKGHVDKDENTKEERERKIKEILKCRFVRINPDIKRFDVYIEIGKIYNIIDEIKEKRNSKLIDKIKRKHKKYVGKIKNRNREVAEGIPKLYGI